jgi:XTP/dITP diphosphohydrolase
VFRYVTTNPGKVREALSSLDDADVSRLDYDYPEIQASELGPIAAAGARDAFAHAGDPVVVDDAGLFVDGFDGFPGPYSAYVEDTLGVDRVRRLVEAELPAGERTAAFRCVIAYCDGSALTVDAAGSTRDPDADAENDAPVRAWVDRGEGSVPDVALFDGRVRGRIVAPRGDGGFGYDPIFERDGVTFAERDAGDKNAVSHRGRALAAFADWYEGRGRNRDTEA